MKKKFKLKNPNLFRLAPNQDYFAIETVHGYSMFVSENAYAGFPKFMIEKNPSLWEFVEEISEFPPKSERPRIKRKRIEKVKA